MLVCLYSGQMYFVAGEMGPIVLELPDPDKTSTFKAPLAIFEGFRHQAWLAVEPEQAQIIGAGVSAFVSKATDNRATYTGQTVLSATGAYDMEGRYVLYGIRWRAEILYQSIDKSADKFEKPSNNLPVDNPVPFYIYGLDHI